MKDASFAIRKAYYELITTATSLPVYEFQAPDEASGNYVILAGQGGSNSETKTTSGSEQTITIDVVTRFKNGILNTKIADDFGNQILQALLPSVGICGLNVTGFKVITTTIETSTLQAQYSSEIIVRKIITATHEIYES